MPLRIGITLGDPAGIGPEIVRSALESGKLASDIDYKVIGQVGAVVAGTPSPDSARGALAAPLEKIAFNLRPGKVSNIIQLGGNYYILKVEDKRGGVTRPFAEVRDEIEKKLVAEEAQAKQERWLTSLRQKAYIKMY